MLFGVFCAAGIWAVVCYRRQNAKKYRPGAEYGSARWGTAKDIQPFINSNFYQNIPLTQTERLTMESRPKQPKYARNKNIIVIGGSGSGKTRLFIKPSQMQMHSSYVVTDPKGTLIIECGQMLIDGGYTVKCLGTSLAGLFMVLVMLPFFFLAMYEKDGLPFEKILSNYLRFAFTEQVRTYQTNNYYRQLEELPEFDPKEAKTVEAKRHRTHKRYPG